MKALSTLFALALVSATASALVHCSSPTSRPPAGGTDVLDGSAGGRDGGEGAADATALVDAGPPAFTVSRTQLDFGSVGCGTAGTPISFAINNTGAGSFDWNSTLLAGGSSLFTLTPPSGTLAPGASQTVNVTMANVPFPGKTDADFYGDQITISAVGRSATPTTTTIPVKLTARGAIVRFAPSSIVFGAVPLNQTSSSSFNVVNDGNSSIELNLIGDNTLFQASPLGPITVGPATSASRSVSFTPTNTDAQTGTFSLSSTNPSNTLCAPLPTTGLAVSGVGSNGKVLVSPTSVLFGDSGLVDCNTQATSQSVSIQNTGNAAFTWSATLSGGSAYYEISPVSGTIQPGATTAVQVTPKKIPATSAVTPDLYAGEVKITTNAIDDPVHYVQLHQTARGLIITSTIGGQAVAFGDVAMSTTAAKQFSLKNEGNVSGTVTLSVGSTSFGVSPASVLLTSNQSSVPTLSFSPTKVQPYTDTLTVGVSGSVALCGLLPASSNLSGNGINAVPTLTITPTQLDFGTANCGSGGGTQQQLTIKNTGLTSFTWTGSMLTGGNSLFTLTPSSGTIASGASQAITVTMANVPFPGKTDPNFYGDQLTVAATATATSTVDVPIKLTAKGAILRVLPSTIDFGNVPLNTTPLAPFSLINDGNADVEVQVVSNNASRFEPAQLSSFLLLKGTTRAMDAKFYATNTSPATATFSVQQPANAVATNKFCAPLPAGVSLSGQGSSGTAAISPPFIFFGDSVPNSPGLQNCGTQASAKVVSVENTGNASLKYAAEITSGGAYYSLSIPAGVKQTVAAATTSTFQIIPGAIPSTSSVADNFYAGTAKVTTYDLSDNVLATQNVALYQTARGVVLTSTLGQQLAFGGVKIGTSAASQFSLTNLGNVDATVELKLSATNSAFSLSSQLVDIPARGTSSQTVRFDPTALQSYSDTLVPSLALADGGVALPVCANLPGSSSLTGQGTNAVGVAPSSLNFGLVNCTSTPQAASPQDVTITNSGPDMNFTPTLGKQSSSPFTLKDKATGNAVTPGVPRLLGSGQAFTLVVVPKLVTRPVTTATNGIGDILTITTDSPGDSPHLVQLNQTARGAFLTVPVKIENGSTTQCLVKFTDVPVTNSGNVDISYKIRAAVRASSLNPGYVCSDAFKLNNLTEGTIYAGQTVIAVLESKSAPACPQAADVQALGDIFLEPDLGGLLCSDPQPSVPLSIVTDCQGSVCPDPQPVNYCPQ